MLTPDDLEVGMYFTIDSWVETKSSNMPAELIAMFPQPEEDRWGMGEIFYIKAIQLPFIAVECLSLPELSGKPFPIDTREAILIRVNKNYVDALKVSNAALAHYRKVEKEFMKILGEKINETPL